jgi:AmmeMemoRadiSam system protein A
MTDSNCPVTQFSTQKGQILVRLARRTLNKKLGRPMDRSQGNALDNALDKALAEPDFESMCGTFVTLTMEGQLRGCIGSLEPVDTIREGVRTNALNAAFHDPRFPPVTNRELDNIDIEISILTRPIALAYTDGKDLAAKLHCGIDGVIICKGSARATFLPQVWDQLPRPEDFLSHLCRKAGLATDAWQATRLTVETYQVQYFHEQK